MDLMDGEGEVDLRDDETLDEIFQGSLKVIQKRMGYRFSLDPILISHFVQTDKDQRVLDLGTGCGIIAMILAKRNESLKIIGVEVQEELADLAQRNVILNRLSERIEIVHQDMKEIDWPHEKGSFDLVLSNPPFRRPDSGRINPLAQKAVARHEIMTSLEDVVRCADRLVVPRGRLALIYPAFRTAHLFFMLRKWEFEPKRLRTIHSHLKAPAKMVLVEAMKGGGEELEVFPPLILYGKGGEYTREMKEIYGMIA